MRRACPCFLLVVAASAGCAAVPPVEPSVEPSSAAAAPVPVAVVDRRPVSRRSLWPALVESAGAAVLADHVILQRARSELAARGQQVGPGDVARERTWLLQSLADDPAEAHRLLARIRQRRGLGPVRFDMLLERNALLRRLVADGVNITDAMVRAAYEREKTVRTRARLILVTSPDKAKQVLDRLEAGEPFIDLALEHSADASRWRGGLLPPIAPHDATFPQALRDAARRLEPGEHSEAIALPEGFAILLCERKIKPAVDPFEQVAERLRRDLKRRQERVRMDRRARALLAESDVSVLDPDLSRVWRDRLQP